MTDFTFNHFNFDFGLKKKIHKRKLTHKLIRKPYTVAIRNDCKAIKTFNLFACDVHK